MSAVERLAFEPLLPAWVAAGLALALVLAAGLALSRGWRRGWARAAVALVAALVLANPVTRVEERAAARDVAVAVIDASASMGLAGRREAARRAVAALRAGAPEVEWRVVEAAQVAGGRTRLGPALERALGAVPGERLAGVVLATDGVVEDAGALAVPPGVPLHVLVAGPRDVADLRLVVTRAPAYALVGAVARVGVRLDGGAGRVDWAIDGRARPPIELAAGEERLLDVRVRRRGAIEVTLAARARAGEATLANNAAVVRVNGVRDRLRVLLVSGAPYPGGRVWRDMLKADDNIDLVHFTILRLPGSYDPTPADELALIPFPVDELFERRLAGFDLIVFDRFGLSELIEERYFARVAQRVRAGGSLLVVAGDEFAAVGGLASTPVAAVLPGTGTGTVSEGFTPVVTARGRAHPVTAALAGPWGAWGSQAVVAPRAGADVLMTGARRRPLLIIGAAGAGRAGLLASTDLWWWARDVAGPGPREALLRRLAHWLMREPDLEEARLRVEARGRRVEVRVEGGVPPGAARLTGPDGVTRSLPLVGGRGVARGAADGLYRVEARGVSRAVLAGEVAELADVTPRAEPLGAVARASGGGVWWLADRVPVVRRMARGGRAAGGGWLGLARGEGGTLLAVRSEPVVPVWVAFGLLAGLLGAAWWRERG